MRKYTEADFQLAATIIKEKVADPTSQRMPDWLLGFKTILMGLPGAGKTSSIPSLLKMGFKVYCAFTEPGVGALNKAMTLWKLSDEERSRLFFAFIKPGVDTFKILKEGATSVMNATEFGKIDGGSRAKYNQLIQLMNLLENFKDHNGVEHGAVSDFDTTSVLVIDGLSGLNKMCMDLVVGPKPTKTLQDWGVAIDQLDKFQQQGANLRCPFILLSHCAMEQEEVTGKILVTLKALGRQLGPSMTFWYNDFIYAKQGADAKFFWSTVDKNCQLKATYLPHNAELPADFRPLVCGWLDEHGLLK